MQIWTGSDKTPSTQGHIQGSIKGVPGVTLIISQLIKQKLKSELLQTILDTHLKIWHGSDKTPSSQGARSKGQFKEFQGTT